MTLINMLSHKGRPVEAEKLKLLLLNNNYAEIGSSLQCKILEGIVNMVQQTDSTQGPGVLSSTVHQQFIEDINTQHPIRSQRYSSPP